MFQNYSQTYTLQITAFAGTLVVLARLGGYEIAENDIIFVLGVLANVGGIVATLYHRLSKGDISSLGRRV